MNLESIVSTASDCHTEEECEDFLMELRWSNGFHCPGCGHEEAFQIRSRKLLECKECRMQVSITAGTIMHKSKLPLLIWFKALQALFERGMEVTAYRLSELLHINYRSAKLLVQKICYAYKIEEDRIQSFQKVKRSLEEQNSVTGSIIKPIKEKLSIKTMSLIECQTYFSAQLTSSMKDLDKTRSTIFRKSMKKLVSIHLYARFLKCFQL
jgi:hypothetical protein